MSRQISITKVLSSGSTLESLYQISHQNIWFLIWALKKVRFWPDLIREALEAPFTMEKKYWPNGQPCYCNTMKNNQFHGICRDWHKSGQLWLEGHWKDGKRNGTDRIWDKNGQLKLESHWKNDKQHGISRLWYTNGQLQLETHWKDGMTFE